MEKQCLIASDSHCSTADTKQRLLSLYANVLSLKFSHPTTIRQPKFKIDPINNKNKQTEIHCYVFTYNFLIFSYSIKLHDITIFEIKLRELCYIFYRPCSYLNQTSLILQSFHPYFRSTSFPAHSFIWFQKVSHM